MPRLTILCLLLTALAVPAAAAAGTVTGGAELKLTGVLKGRVVATEPAKATRTTLSLPGYEGAIGSTSATLRHSGVVQVKTKRARLNLVALITTLSRHSKTTALVGGKRITVLTYSGAPVLTSGSARLTGAKVTLAKAAAKALRRSLGLKQLRAGRIGTADVAVASPASGPSGQPTPVPSTSPGTQRITWRPRESWIQYTSTGEGSSVSGGAAKGPEEVRPPSDQPLVYSFAFPSALGTLGFAYSRHGIDITFTDPRVTGDQLSVVFGGKTSGDYAGRRVAMLDLSPAQAASHEGDSYEGVPATLTEDGSKAFAGFYAPGDEWGTVSYAGASAATRSARLAAVSKLPRRIVALSPFTANTLVDLGIKPIAIANTLGGQDRFRPQLKGVRRLELSHPNGPNLEELAELDPDLVLSSPTWSRGHKAMRELGMKVALADPTAVSNVAAMTRRLGRLVGRRKAANRIATRQQEAIDDAKVGIDRHPKVLAVLGVGRAPYAFLPSSWGGDLVTQAGGTLLTQGLKGDGGFAKISDEEVVARNPDIIIAVPHGKAKDIPSIAEYLRNNPSWKNTNAGRNDRIYVAQGNSLLQAFTDMGRTIRDIGTMFLKNR